MKKLLIVVLLISLLALPVFATGDSETKNLTVYAGMLEEHAAAVCQAFEAETGIKTNFVRMSGGEIFARIKAEKENPQASVWYGGGSLTFIEAANEGLLVPYTSPATDKIPAQFKDSKGYWTGIYTGYLGFYADKDWLAKVGMDMPDSWEDLLDPRLKGEIVMAHPGSSSTAYNMLTTVLQVMGEEKGWQYLQKLNQNIRQYTKSGSAGGRMVQLRETGLTIGYLHDAISFKREGYDHIVMSAPSEGTGYEIGAVGIIKGAPELEEAKQFVDFVLRSDVQEIGQTVNALQFLTNPDAVPPEEVASIKGAKLITQDDAWSGAHRSEFLEKFNELTKTTVPTT
ncbi:MAG: ABC transporter substrate-binding protein [Sphaerochaetaceae bacterium]|nr:ABC transporter substrate-binding protein [Sphaerochaetaceae bacterium]